ncbi:MAG: hypothetical protein NVS2B11_03440 [Acetobacteraceae bacterium]
MAAANVVITSDQVPKLLRAIEDLTRQQVLVGIPGDAEPRTGGGPTNAYLGYLHEFGAPGANIPARPFLRPGIDGAMGAIIARLRAGAKAATALPVDASVPSVVLNSVGLIAQTAVRRYINAGVPPPLAAATLYARKHRKVAPRMGEVPLIDTGQLRNAVVYVIRDTRR